MRLTLQTDYALRTLVYLAAGNGDWPSVRVIAEAYDISRPHLVKVVQALGRAGFVETRPGRSGGVKLAKPPEEIVVGEVVRRLEPSLVPVVCLDPSSEQSCVISPAWSCWEYFLECTSTIIDPKTVPPKPHIQVTPPKK